MSRWERWTTKPKQGMSLSGFIAEQQSPAEMAKSMGLQSDGSGGYIDPETGEVVARTVNNELVFYDPMGGAISAQSDGAALTQAQPSWRDPVTGEITVPPGQAESPEEISAIPDPVPALAPASYNAFMTKKKKDMYAQQGTPEQEEIDDVQQEVDPQLGMQPEMGMGEELLTFSQMMEARRKAAPIKTTVDPQIAADYAAQQKPKGPTVVQTQPQQTRQAPTQPLNTAPTPEVQQAKKSDEISSEMPQSNAQRLTHDSIREANQQTTQENDRLFETVNASLKERYKSKKKYDDVMAQHYEPLKKLLSEIKDPTARDRKTEAFINAMSTGSRVNHGSNSLSGKQLQGLSDRRSTLDGLDIDDKGVRDFDRIRNFKKDQILYDDISDDYVMNSYNLLPEHVVKSLSHTSRKGLSDEQFDALKERFPLAIERGKGKNRHLDYSPIFWKQFLETGGIDAYTGQILDINDLNIEHMIPGSEGSKNKELYDWVEDPDNKVLTHRAPNQTRGNKTLHNFLESTLKDYNPISNDVYDYMVDAEDGLQGIKSRARDLDITNLDELMIDHGEDGQEEGIFRPEMTEEIYQENMKHHQAKFDNMKESVFKALSEKFDPEGNGYHTLTSAKLNKKIEELGLDENAAHRLRAIANVYSKAKGLKPDFGKIMTNMKLGSREEGKQLPTVPRTDPAHGGVKTGSSANDEALNKLWRQSLFQKDRETQQSRKRLWNDAIESGSNASRLADEETKSLGIKDGSEYFRRRERTKFLGLQTFHKKLMESGFLDDGVLDADEYKALKADLEYHSNTDVDDHLALFDQQEDQMSKGKYSGKKSGWFNNHLDSLMSESFENVDLDDDMEDDLITDQSSLDKLLQALSMLMDTEGGVSRETPSLNFDDFRAKMKK